MKFKTIIIILSFIIFTSADLLAQKVITKQYLEELHESKISDIDCEDVYLKKTIANTNLGILEKGVNRAQASKMFDTLEEAQYYQAKYGGLITFISKNEENCVQKFKTYKHQNISNTIDDIYLLYQHVRGAKFTYAKLLKNAQYDEENIKHI